MVRELEEWIKGILIGRNRSLRPVGFPSSLILSHTPLEDGDFDFAPWLLGEKAVYKAPFEDFAGKSACNQLLQSVQRAGRGESAYWFYVTDPDNDYSVLSWVKPCDYDQSFTWEEWLEPIEKTPAVEGGDSYIGLAGVGRQWLLLQKFSPFGEFTISVHGSPEFCREVSEGIGGVA